jgi:serine/threonine protein kinase/tetratricopeptide (TPR) repeat protein
VNATIGAGGMGEVYRATDTRLGREVALKVLPADFAHDPERLARFQREARAVAALNHPNIVTIFSVEEADGTHFLTMELVEGQCLDHRIPAGGMAVGQIVEIAGAMADALASAHEKGIVHRDLKPANVMLTRDGRVKVLDFGLAKDIAGNLATGATMTSDGHTQAGLVMGTPAYMSPEQISGRPLDHRTDIFSLGVVLYEMATGLRPFQGASSAELLSALLRDNPAPVTELRADLPADLARIIRRCLEKDPRHRMQTARDVSNEFRDLGQTITRTAPPSTSMARAKGAADSGATRTEEGFWVAVLPFKHKGSEPGLDALAEGLTEEIITGMSRFSYLRVIVHGSTVKYSPKPGDVRAIAKELGARYVMEGSIRHSGARVRIAVQLVDAVSRATLWAETYERAFRPDASFELQDELVPIIVSTVGDTQGVLPRTMSESLRGKEPAQLSPFEAVVRCIAYQYRITAKEHAIVVEGLERAVQQAPGYAPAWAMLAHMYKEEYAHRFNLRPDALERASAAARRAIEAAPGEHLAYYALASASFFRKEWDAFRSATQRTITLNPMDGFAVGYLGMLTAYSGDWELGCAMSERARTLNPHHPSWYWFTQVFDAYNKGNLRDALGFAQKINLPGFWRTPFAFAAIYGHLGEVELAREAVRSLLAVRPHFLEEGRDECLKWWQPDLAENLIDGLRKAGLDLAVAPPA